jgi:hypothetical protein
MLTGKINWLKKTTVNSRKQRHHKILLYHGNKLLLWSF